MEAKWMSKYKVTVIGKTYEVEVEDIDDSVSLSAVRPVAASVSTAPKPAPAAAPAARSDPKPIQVQAPAPTPALAASDGAEDIISPMPGTVLNVLVNDGQTVTKGQMVLVFEAMKMENEIFASADATVSKVHVAKGDAIETGTLLISLA